MRVLLVPNALNPVALGAATELASWLASEGFEPILTPEDAHASGLADFAVGATEVGEPALVVALGGDGTILKAVHALGEVEVPILGVNLGRLGFLSGAGAGSVRHAVGEALSGDARVERRATLQAEVQMEGRTVGTYRALNEVYLGRGAGPRVVAFDLFVNGTLISRVRADGFIVATPTGSTAYALSAGGPIVSPEVGAMVVAPVAPHTLQARTIMVSWSDVVEIHLPDPGRSEACLAVDGDSAPCRRAIERLSVSRGAHDVLLVKLDGRDFYEVVAAEFYGA